MHLSFVDMFVEEMQIFYANIYFLLNGMRQCGSSLEINL